MCWDVLGGRVVTGLFLLAVFARICRARHLSAQPQPSQCCPSLERCRNWKAAETADDLNWARLRVCHSLPLYTIQKEKDHCRSTDIVIAEWSSDVEKSPSPHQMVSWLCRIRKAVVFRILTVVLHKIRTPSAYSTMECALWRQGHHHGDRRG